MHEETTPNHLVIFMPSGRRGRIASGTLVLDAARQLGVEIESICGGRLTCNKCRIRVEEGQFAKHGITSAQSHLTPASDEEIRLLEKLESPDCRLSCNAKIVDDALIFVPEESRAHKQVVRKAATDRIIDLFPTVRQIFVEVDNAELGEHRGDWGRLQDALAAKWNLHNLTIDLPVLRELQANLRKGKWSVTVTLWQEREVIDVQPGYQEGVYGLAVDIGSTTIAGFLCDLRTGEILATESMMNPQVTYGEDLMSRISFAMMHNDGLEKMHTAVIEALNRLAASTARAAGIRQRQIQEAVIVGNTTMTHIFLGINPIELGGAPFALANRDSMNVKARALGLRLHRSANIHVLPAEAGHVGADNVAALIAEEPYNQEAVTLLVDVGTNAEIVLGNKAWMLSASSPTGPAFEGAQIRFGMRAAPGAIERVRIDPETLAARFRVIGEDSWSDAWQIGPQFPVEAQPQHLAAGICGSGIIEVVAEMFLAGILLPDGRFNPTLHHERIRWDERRGEYIVATAEQTTTGSPIVVTQEDVRNIQLAKAALYAGTKLLMNEAKLTHVDRIVLAGAFGSYIDPKYAMILGLIHDCDLAQVTAVGNAAGDGARIALLNKHKREEAQRISEWVRYVETAVHPDFQQEFVGAIHLPHATDPFPHLNGLLPDPMPNLELNGNGRRKRRRRRNKKITTKEEK
ncbi:ASKHA domain-containing protein [Candidatus Leptofilum sp.]|uniref:ASKHA domain-containing protein n=1 Tax=Candidatus Leptofilum sp. TaxID=3241576 RepID=UPI003B5BC644